MGTRQGRRDRLEEINCYVVARGSRILLRTYPPLRDAQIMRGIALHGGKGLAPKLTGVLNLVYWACEPSWRRQTTERRHEWNREKKRDRCNGKGKTSTSMAAPVQA